jgi:hypothetical protein
MDTVNFYIDKVTARNYYDDIGGDFR